MKYIIPNEMNPSYIVERWPLGWLICGAPGIAGVPLGALAECQPMFPKKSILDAGIVHHYRASGRYEVMMCVAAEKDSKTWRDEIIKSLMTLPLQEQWWKGVDVGKSSAAMFAVFCEDRLKAPAREFGQGAVPQDASDLGRCIRLLDIFQEWKPRLKEVSEAYPDTKWPRIIEHWDRLVSLSPEEQYVFLR